MPPAQHPQQQQQQVVVNDIKKRFYCKFCLFKNKETQRKKDIVRMAQARCFLVSHSL